VFAPILKNVLWQTFSSEHDSLPKKGRKVLHGAPKALTPRLRLSTTPQTISQLVHYLATTIRPLLLLSLSLQPKHLKTIIKNHGPKVQQ
jgi:hypothetical protein